MKHWYLFFRYQILLQVIQVLKKPLKQSLTGNQQTSIATRSIYLRDQDDSTYRDRLEPFSSDEIVHATHIWNQEGTCQIRVKPQNDTGLVSDWSNLFSVYYYTKQANTKDRMYSTFRENYE